MRIHIVILWLAATMLSCNRGSELITNNQNSPDEDLTIEYLAHAAFRLTSSDTSILLDPFADRVWLGYDFPKEIEADAVFITHPHYDHDGGIFRGLAPEWMCRIPFYQNPKAYKIGPFAVQGIRGKHAEPYGAEFGKMNTIWKIQINNMVLAHWGDNGPITEELVEMLSDVDILFIPMDGDFHILPLSEYEEIFKYLSPSIIIPMHYRIAELENNPDSPSDLGELEPFLAKRPAISVDSSESYIPEVITLENNWFQLQYDDLPKRSTYYVFQPSPLITRP